MVNVKLDNDNEIKLKPHLKEKGDLDRFINDAIREKLDRMDEEVAARRDEERDERIKALIGWE